MFRRCFLGNIGAVLSASLAALAGTPRAEAAPMQYHAGHSCPRCGRQVVAIHSFRRDGRHVHRCGGTYWYH